MNAWWGRRMGRMRCTMKRRPEKLLFRLFNRTTCERQIIGILSDGISGLKRRRMCSLSTKLWAVEQHQTWASSRFLSLLSTIFAYLWTNLPFCSSRSVLVHKIAFDLLMCCSQANVSLTYNEHENLLFVLPSFREDIFFLKHNQNS